MMQRTLFDRLGCMVLIGLAFVAVASANVVTFNYSFAGTVDGLVDVYGYDVAANDWPSGISPSSSFIGGLTLDVQVEDCAGGLCYDQHEVTSFWLTVDENSYVVPVGTDDVIWGSYNQANYNECGGTLNEYVFTEALIYGEYGFAQLSFCYDSADLTWTWMNLYFGGDMYSTNEDKMVLRAESCDGSMITVTSDIVPEPATLSLLAMGGLALLRRRRA